MESGLYEGVVCHERLTPVRRRFQYRLGLAYLDLGELPAAIASGVISGRRWGLGAFRRADHLGPADEPLERTIRDLVAAETGHEPKGPIRLLTQLSWLGVGFSPLNLYYCFDLGGEIEAVVAEVRNTPWLERHAYVLRGTRGYRHAKTFHVSPFMEMDLDYRWHLSRPGEALNVDIENLAGEETIFRAGLRLKRRELTRANVRGMLLRHPLQPICVTAAIYYQAFQLWRRKCPYHPHPGSKATETCVLPGDGRPRAVRTRGSGYVDASS